MLILSWWPLQALHTSVQCFFFSIFFLTPLKHSQRTVYWKEIAVWSQELNRLITSSSAQPQVKGMEVLTWIGLPSFGGVVLNRWTLKINPGLFLLGLLDEGLPLSKLQQKLLYKLIWLARRCILFQWIKRRPATVNQWYGKIFKVLPMEHLSSVLKGNQRHFKKLWGHFLDPKILET